MYRKYFYIVKHLPYMSKSAAFIAFVLGTYFKALIIYSKPRHVFFCCFSVQGLLSPDKSEPPKHSSEKDKFREGRINVMRQCFKCQLKKALHKPFDL